MTTRVTEGARQERHDKRETFSYRAAAHDSPVSRGDLGTLILTRGSSHWNTPLDSVRASRFLCISLPSLLDHDLKLSNFTFCGGRESNAMIFY